MRRSFSAVPWLLLAGLAACTESSTAPPDPAVRVAVAAGNQQNALAGSAVALEPTVLVTDGSGRPRKDIAVSFAVTAGGGWTRTASTSTDASGRASSWWLLGPDPREPQRLRASAGAVAVEFTATATAPAPGTTRLGRAGYIEYIAGDLPLVITAPHGGSLVPGEIPDRTVGTSARDTNTEELVRTLRQAFTARTGGTPHVIINRLHRSKLDANREIVEAAQGNPFAERAWFEWHAFIEAAKVAAAAAGPAGAALYFDMHGHGHPTPRVEIGYLLGASDLALSDAAFGQPAIIAKSSIRALARNDGARFRELVRGPTSLGQLLHLRGYPAVPSASDPSPGTDPYFTGGYNTERHGSKNGGTVSGIQLELYFPGIRDTEANRARFASALADAVASHFQLHVGVPLSVPGSRVLEHALQRRAAPARERPVRPDRLHLTP
jgi:hypothetical protein